MIMQTLLLRQVSVMPRLDDYSCTGLSLTLVLAYAVFSFLVVERMSVCMCVNVCVFYLE